MLGSRTNKFNRRNLFDSTDLDKNVQAHLKNVYGMLSIGVLSACAGAYAYMISSFLQSITSGLMTISVILSLGSLMYIYFKKHSRETIANRTIAFLTFTTLSGLNLAPLLRHITFIDPSIIPTAFFGTAMIFVSFTLAALFTRNRYYLYLGAILSTACSLLMTMMLVNMFMRSPMLNSAQVYIGLLVFLGFIVFDTQLMVAKRRMGDTDFIWHSLDLFIDFIEVFTRILMILTDKRENRREED